MSEKKILVVDDDPDVRQLLEVCLRGAGYAVSFATDGLSCLMQAQHTHPDVVILDLGLPAGDGMTALKRLRASSKLAGLPVIVLSARDEERWAPAALEAGANLYFRKPVHRETLLAALEQVLGETRPGQPIRLAAVPGEPPRRVQAGPPPLGPALRPGDTRTGSLSCPHCGETLATVNVVLDPAPAPESRGEAPAA
jgi:DNA-binding response OmpR family regulator